MFLAALPLGFCLFISPELGAEDVGSSGTEVSRNIAVSPQFEKIREELRKRETYKLDLLESVQFLNLDPSESRQSLRRDGLNYELVTPNSRAVLLDDIFGFLNSTKPERCVWRPAQGSFFDEIGRLKSVVATFVALGSEKSTEDVLLKFGLGLDATLKFGSPSEVVHEVHGSLNRITLETSRGQTHWDFHPESGLVMRLSTNYAPPDTPESVRIRRTIDCTWSFPNELDPAISFVPEGRTKFPTIESLFTWDSPQAGPVSAGGMPGDAFPTVELNSLSGQPWTSDSISGQEHLYLFWNSTSPPQRLLIRSLQGLGNNPKGCDLTCINLAEPGSIDAERWQKASESFKALRVSGVRSLFDPSSNLFSALEVNELPLLLHVGQDGSIKTRWSGKLHREVAGIMNAVLSD